MPRRTRPAPSESWTEIPSGPPVSRREWLAIGAVVLVAAGLRFAFPSRMAIEHFDEGVYASNVFFGPEEGNRYPYRHLYAPPLLPWLVEISILLLGPEGIAPFLPALVLGTATVPLAWWVVRSWFGPGGGLAAAVLVATSDIHIFYGRTALTDAPVTFFILLAVYFYWGAVRWESYRWSLTAGVATALAWWTKYTGWLPLAIALAGSAAWVLFEHRTNGMSLLERARNPAKCFAVMAITAFIGWSPVLWGLQPYGGYSAVAANHRRYLDGGTSWFAHAWEQGGDMATVSGWMTAFALGGLVCAALSSMLRLDGNRVRRAALSATAGLISGCVTFLVGPALPLTCLATTSLAAGLSGRVRLGRFRREEPSTNVQAAMPSLRALGLWLLAAWLVGLFVATPFYAPYPRLALPWVIAALLGCGGWARVISGEPSHSREGLAFFLPAVLILPFLAALVGPDRVFGNLPPWAFGWSGGGWSIPAWEDRSGLASATRRIGAMIREERRLQLPAAVYVYGDPAVFYHLAPMRNEPNATVVPIGEVPAADGIPVDTDVFLVIGPNSDADSPSADLWPPALSRQAETKTSHLVFDDGLLRDPTFARTAVARSYRAGVR